MNRLYFLLLSAVTVGVAGLATPAAASRLLDQQVHGLTRICIYEGTGQSRLPGVRPRRSLTVGIGEPCPTRYPDLDLSATKIPPQARLIGRSTIDGEQICIYAFNSRNYQRRQARGTTCSYLPGS